MNVIEPRRTMRLTLEYLTDGKVTDRAVDHLDGSGDTHHVPTPAAATAHVQEAQRHVDRLIEALTPVIGREQVLSLDSAVGNLEAHIRCQAVAVVLHSLWRAFDWPHSAVLIVDPDSEAGPE